MSVLGNQPEATRVPPSATLWEFPLPHTWQDKFANLARTRLFPLLAALISVLCFLGASSLLLWNYPQYASQIFVLQLSLVATGFIFISATFYRVYVNLVKPLNDMRRWAHRMRSGDLSARIPDPPESEIAKLVNDLNSVGKELQVLNTELDSRVRMQTDRLAVQTRSLEILYDVAATVNESRDLDDLLIKFLNTITEVTDARAAAVRLLTPDNQLKLVSSIGLDREVIELENMVCLDRCLCGHVLQSGVASCQKDLAVCGEHIGRPLFEKHDMEMLTVPIQHRDRQLGVFNLFLDKSGIGINADTRELLTSVGRQVGTALEKAQLERQTHRLSIIQERNMIAHELHDSLAQTLASMRFQVKVLNEVLDGSENRKARKELNLIHNSIDEANTELRELLSQFRAPIDERGLLHALEAIVNQFRQETKIQIFLQKQCTEENLPALMEMQVLRIIQESLANIKKHAQANTVRVLLRCNHRGEYLVLIEDDGVGFGELLLDGNPGEHIGLSIMQERAQHLGGELRIESEPGEGTRIELMFTYNGATTLN